MTNSLKEKALSGIVWKFFETALTSVFGFFISVILARLLSPSDYGLIGMMAVFIALSEVFIDSGFSDALIQKKNRTDVDFSTVFFFNILVSIICYILLFVSAPLIADFFNAPMLVLIVRVLGLKIVINSFASIQITKLRINVNFKLLAISTLISVVIGGLVGIYLAYMGFGVWSLVYQLLIGSLFQVFVLWLVVKWRPQFVFSKFSLKSLFGFGSKLLLGGLYRLVVSNVYNLVIGRAYSASELGIYTRANQLPEMVSQSLNSVVNSVTFPLLSTVNDDQNRMISVYSKMLTMTAFIVFPIMTLMALLARPFVIVVLTDKWIAVVPLMIWLSFARLTTPITTLNISILTASGRSDLYLKADLLRLPLIVINLVITIPLGVNAVAMGNTIVIIISYFVFAYYPGKFFGYGVFKQSKLLFKIVLSVLLMSIVVIGFLYLSNNNYLSLFIGGLIGIIAYLVFSYILKIEEFEEVKKILKKFLGFNNINLILHKEKK